MSTSGGRVIFNQLDITLETDTIIRKHAEALADDISAASPVGQRGQYAKGWTVQYDKTKAGGKTIAIVYNETDPQLTHLLEFGHRIGKTNQFARPHPHIRPATEARKKQFLNDMKNIGINVTTKEA